MFNVNNCVIILILFITSFPLYSDVYKYKNSDGSIYYDSKIIKDKKYEVIIKSNSNADLNKKNNYSKKIQNTKDNLSEINVDANKSNKKYFLYDKNKLTEKHIANSKIIGSLGFPVVTPISSVPQTRSGVPAHPAKYAGTIGPSYRYRSSGV